MWQSEYEYFIMIIQRIWFLIETSLSLEILELCHGVNINDSELFYTKLINLLFVIKQELENVVYIRRLSP